MASLNSVEVSAQFLRQLVDALIRAGANVRARNRRGCEALHRAVRTRCAGAVRTLMNTTGRTGSGSPAAKAQQEEILQLLHGHGWTRMHADKK